MQKAQRIPCQRRAVHTRPPSGHSDSIETAPSQLQQTLGRVRQTNRLSVRRGTFPRSESSCFGRTASTKNNHQYLGRCALRINDFRPHRQKQPPLPVQNSVAQEKNPRVRETRVSRPRGSRLSTRPPAPLRAARQHPFAEVAVPSDVSSKRSSLASLAVKAARTRSRSRTLRSSVLTIASWPQSSAAPLHVFSRDGFMSDPAASPASTPQCVSRW